jgi:hypothetical protein
VRIVGILDNMVTIYDHIYYYHRKRTATGECCWYWLLAFGERGDSQHNEYTLYTMCPDTHYSIPGGYNFLIITHTGGGDSLKKQNITLK